MKTRRGGKRSVRRMGPWTDEGGMKGDSLAGEGPPGFRWNLGCVRAYHLPMRTPLWRAVGLFSLLAASQAWGQGGMNFGATVSGDGVPTSTSDIPPWVRAQIQDPDDPRVQAYARQQKIRVQLEKELYKIRFEYIHNIKNKDIRSAGIHKIRQ